jgi:translation initiation factor 3 subunit I
MKPLLLQAHERSLTQIKFNSDGDLLFSVSKDSNPCVWFTHNGELLGSYSGHNGTVWCVDPRFDSSLLLTGSADCSAKVWDIQTGKELYSITAKSPIRTCGWSYSGNQFFISTDKNMGQQCHVKFYNIEDLKKDGSNAQPYLEFQSLDSKVTTAVWGPLDETLITGHDNGDISKWDSKTGKRLMCLRSSENTHTAAVTDIQMNKTQTLFITASKDTWSKLFDVEDFKVLKVYKTERPVNSAAISPLKDHVLTGGGQDARSVTTTGGAKQGKFEARFFHMIFEEKLGTVKGHFGPINSVAFTPDGKSYASGGEDGYIRLHNFDPSYFDFEFEY